VFNNVSYKKLSSMAVDIKAFIFYWTGYMTEVLKEMVLNGLPDINLMPLQFGKAVDELQYPVT
jgi:hypothetical protein